MQRSRDAEKQGEAPSTKAEIRRSILERLKKQSPTARIRKSRAIEKKLFQKKVFQKAKTVMFYASLPEEVQTRAIIVKALAEGKRVLLPRLEGIRLQPKEIHDMTRDLVSGRFGILEPKRNFPSIPLREIDCVIVPGVAFDRKGNRLGRGGGYYDRFLKRLPRKTPSLGLAFRLQTVSALPTSSRDVPVTALIAA